MSRSIVVTMLAAAALLGGCTSYGARHYPPGCPQSSAPWPPPAPLPPPPPPRL
ncbi:hypothetical protein [Brevundimonas sp. NIBR10]|uniref:hypothetical protein n=1 Tax=Brevundimonas sp. NIBR10 TaxID=3015997 RepID=UPI0022F1D9CF|nr:hypothetical protein [Brevundimonas sp. NIBR10]